MRISGDSQNTMEEFTVASLMSQSDSIAEELADTSDLPTSLIITNVDIQVFSEVEARSIFEQLFQKFEEDATFQYFRSFRRVRVNYQNPASAAKARIQCHQARIGESVMNCYFAQPSSLNKDCDSSEAHLQPPSPVRQFLISPPASPPVGWEPVDEAAPILNYDLLSAVATLAPGESHELHPASESQPGIVVHVCEDQEPGNPKLKMIQTRCPERNSSLDSPDSPSPPDSPSEVS